MVNNRTALDPRWELRTGKTVAAGFQTATVKIIRKEPLAERTYDQATRTWSAGGFTTIYEGKARIQPYGIIRPELDAQDATGKRLVRVQIDSKSTGARLDDMLFVTECNNNPDMVGYEYGVKGALGSNLEWLTDLLCEANLKGV